MKGTLIAIIATAVTGALLFTVSEFTKDKAIYDYCDIWFLDCEHCNKSKNCLKIRKEFFYD